MTFDIAPSSFWRFPTARNMWDDDDFTLSSAVPSGISISEDDQHVYVDLALPGVEPQDAEVTFDKGILWVKAEVKEEEKKKKYYRKATSTFSYRVAVPGDIDSTVEPTAKSKNGVMKVTFTKSPKTQPKKITVKS